MNWIIYFLLSSINVKNKYWFGCFAGQEDSDVLLQTYFYKELFVSENKNKNVIPLYNPVCWCSVFSVKKNQRIWNSCIYSILM